MLAIKAIMRESVQVQEKKKKLTKAFFKKKIFIFIKLECLDFPDFSSQISLTLPNYIVISKWHRVKTGWIFNIKFIGFILWSWNINIYEWK